MRGTLLLLLALVAVPATASSAPDLRAGSRVELLPATDGSTGVRVLHGMRLGVDLAARWRLDLAVAARFGTWTSPDRSAELSRIALSYSTPGFSLSAGRVHVVSGTGARMLDGVALRWGRPGSPLGGRAWVGHPWHPELGLLEHPSLAAGGELLLRPPGPAGRIGPVMLTVGGAIRGAGAAPDGRLWLRADGMDARGGSWTAGVEGGLGGSFHGALRGWAIGSGPVGRRIRLGGEVRWEGLPRVALPMTAPSALELLSPQGYGVARAHADVEVGPVVVRASGGPTLVPRVDGPTVGGVGRLGASVPLGARVRVGGLGVFAQAGRSRVGGGGAHGSLRLRSVEVDIDGTLLRFAGLDHSERWVGELRARAGVLLPPLHPEGPAVRLAGGVAVGADRVLASWVRGGLSLEVVLPGRRG